MLQGSWMARVCRRRVFPGRFCYELCVFSMQISPVPTALYVATINPSRFPSLSKDDRDVCVSVFVCVY